MPRRKPSDRSAGDQSQPQNGQVWQRRTKRTLTSEDEREIEQNLAGFFRLLAEWAAKESGESSRETAGVASKISDANG